MITNGYYADDSEIVEVVDLSSPDAVCMTLPGIISAKLFCHNSRAVYVKNGYNPRLLFRWSILVIFQAIWRNKNCRLEQYLISDHHLATIKIAISQDMSLVELGA